MLGELHTPVSLRVLWLVPEVCVHLTLQPVAIETLAGVKAKLEMLTSEQAWIAQV